MKRTRTLLMLLMLGGLSACASVVPPDAPAFSRAQPPDAGHSNLYIYRTGAFPKARAPSVLVDGKRVFDLPEGAYTVLTLAPGQHKVEIAWALDIRQRNRRTLVSLGERGEKYLKITGDFDYQPGSFEQEVLMELTAGRMSFPHTYTWLVEIPQDTAESEMRGCCRHLAP